MADWPLLRNSLAVEDDAALASYGATVTAGSANTKGSYTQIVASLARSCSGILLQMFVATQVSMLMDIAIGGAGSEIVVIPNLSVSAVGSTNVSGSLFIPLYLPAGTRVAVRCQASTGSATVRVKSVFITDTFIGLQQLASRYENWGAVAATSRGTLVTASGSVDTKGAWTQLIAASAFTTKWLLIGLQPDFNRNYAVDIGVGGAGAEQVVIPNLDPINISLGTCISLPFSIPGGSRVSARAAANVGSITIPVDILGGA